VCQEYREIQQITERGHVDGMRQLIEWLLDALTNAEEELAMYRCEWKAGGGKAA